MRKKDIDRLLDEFRDKCRKHNLSITPQRTAIYRALLESDNHPTCEDIHRRVRTAFPELAIDTVYRTLSTFAEIDLIDEVEGYGEPKRYDPETEAHHHFRCRKCNKIIDFREKSFDNLKAPARMRRKYAISNIRVILEGLCDTCMKT